MMERHNGGAIAYVRGDVKHPALRGTVEFIPYRKGTLVTVHVTGLPQSNTGFFALHVHEGDSCRGDGFPNTGSHYNPKRIMHPNHAGDLPPLLSNGGSAYLSVYTERFLPSQIIGKTVVIHSEPDDFHSQPAGNSGDKIGCGRILRRW